MGKDKKKFKKVKGRLNLDTQVITLVVPRGGHYLLPGCRGTGGLCGQCCQFRGAEGGEGCKIGHWMKFNLPGNRETLNQLISDATMPWENKRVIVDVTLLEEPKTTLIFRGPRKYKINVRVSASMKLDLFVRSLPLIPPPSLLEPTPKSRKKQPTLFKGTGTETGTGLRTERTKHNHSFVCGCYLLFSDVVSAAFQHREEEKSLAKTLEGTVREFLGTCVSRKLSVAVPTSAATALSLSPLVKAPPLKTKPTLAVLKEAPKVTPVLTILLGDLSYQLLHPSKVLELMESKHLGV